MKASLRTKLDQLLERYEELAALLSDSEVIANQTLYREYSKEYAELEPLVLCYRSFEDKSSQLEEAKLMLTDSDHDIRDMAREETSQLGADIEVLDAELQKLLLRLVDFLTDFFADFLTDFLRT